MMRMKRDTYVEQSFRVSTSHVSRAVNYTENAMTAVDDGCMRILWMSLQSSKRLATWRYSELAEHVLIPKKNPQIVLFTTDHCTTKFLILSRSAC